MFNPLFQTYNPISYIQAFWLQWKKGMSKKLHITKGKWEQGITYC